MFVADGIDDVAILGVPFTLGDFTLALWFRSESQLGPHALFGVATAGSADVFKCEVGPGTGFGVTMIVDAMTYQAIWDGASLLDGLWHLIVIRRAEDVFTLRVDGRHPADVDEGGDIDDSVLPFTVPMALGAVNVNGATTAQWYEADFGQWALWNVALSDEQLLLLAAGETPANMATGLVEHWRCFENLIDSSGAACTFLRGAFANDMVAGYRIYSRMSDAPVVGEDAPVLCLAEDVDAAVIDEAVLALAADGTANVAVGAFGLGGHSELSHASFLTDEDAHPLHVPSKVTLEPVRTLAAGKVRVTWSYFERLESLAVADQFRVEFTPEDGQTPVADLLVTAGVNATYSVESVTLEDGAWTVRVYSMRDGNYREPVDSQPAIADGTAPTDTIEALEVVG